MMLKIKSKIANKKMTIVFMILKYWQQKQHQQ